MSTTSSKIGQFWRLLAAPPAQVEVSYAYNTTLNLQIWLSTFPWRPTAGWAVVAALLSTGLLAQPFDLNWQMLALLLLLVDLLWGGIWRLAAGRSEMLPLHTQVVPQRVWLPYLQPDSPAHKLFGWDNSGVLPLLFRVALPSVALALALASVLGVTAVGLTGLVVLISILGWTSRRALAMRPQLLQSIATIGLPWLLTLQLLPHAGEGTPALTPLTSLTLLWVLHNWGEGRLLCAPHDWLGRGLLALAEIGIILLLVLVRSPLWLGLLVVIWLPAWLLLYLGQPLQRVSVWWLAAMLISALALGQV